MAKLYLCAVLAISSFVVDHVVAGKYTPALLIATNPLKPRIGKSVEQHDEFERATGPLNRLLLARQTTCPAGYGACAGNANTCCPTGGQCCTQTNGCCAAGQFCYGTGCCDNADFGCSGSSCCPTGANCCSSGGCCSAGDDCVVVGGQNGCCPTGTTCSGSPTGCSLPGYVPCSNENFCCLPGDTCFVDNTGQPGCDSVGGSSAPPASSAGPTVSSSFASPSLSFSSSSASSGIPTGHPFTQSFPPNVAPSGSQGASNSTIAATDPRVSYSGASWAPDTPPCGGSAKRATTAGDSLTLQFVGTAVYLNSVVGPNAGVYTVEVDQQPASLVSVDGSSSSTSTCSLNWSSFGMEDQLHTITVTYVGASRSGGSAATASFEFANFIVTTTGGSSTSQPSSGPTGAASGAVSTIDGGLSSWNWISTSWAMICGALML